jgi:hypothetical protein
MVLASRWNVQESITKTWYWQLIPETRRRYTEVTSRSGFLGTTKRPPYLYHDAKILISLFFLAVWQKHHSSPLPRYTRHFLEPISFPLHPQHLCFVQKSLDFWAYTLLNPTAVFYQLLSCTEINRFPSRHNLEFSIWYYNVSGDWSHLTIHFVDAPSDCHEILSWNRNCLFSEYTYLLKIPLDQRLLQRVLFCTESTGFWAYISLKLLAATSGCYSDCCRVQKSSDFRAHSSLNLPLVVTTTLFCTEINYFPSIHLVKATCGRYSDCCCVQKSPDFRAHSSLNFPVVVSTIVIRRHSAPFDDHSPPLEDV